jgi:hypothetical protein
MGCGIALAGCVLSVPAAQAAMVYGVTQDNALFSFDSAAPGTLLSGLSISGFSANNESIRGIDFRPANGQLYAIGSFGQLYTLDKTTAVLTAVGGGVGAINGTAFGFDFNPTIDRIRLVSNTDRNYVLNPDTGALQATATPLAYGAGDPNFGVNPNVVGSAYSNNNLGNVPATSQLYGIDAGIDVLVKQANNDGVLETVGPLLTVNTSDLVGFDIFTTPEGDNIAYASLTPSGGSVSNFYTVDLITGTAVLVGQINGGTLVSDIAVEPVAIPEPASLALVGLGAIGLLARRRGA